MKIFLTGSTGMVGKNILEHPLAKKYNFLCPTSKELNLLDYTQVSDFISHNKPDLIIHCAGVVGGIQANLANPVQFLTDNTLLGINVINSAKKHGVKKLLNLSSSCIYPKNGTNPLSENYLLKGELEPTNEGYALAKITAVKLCDYICRETPDFLYKTIIPCNLYGRFDKFDSEKSHMLPAVIKKIHQAKINNLDTIEIWGNGEARREFMYASDLADFIFYAIPKLHSMPSPLNVGLGLDYTINEYYKAVAKVVGYSGDFTHDLTKPVGMKQKLIDKSKLMEFGWGHKTSLLEGIKKTYHYFLDGEGKQ